MAKTDLKICLIIDDYLPHSIKVGAKMMHELAIEFVMRGYSVTVITPSPQLNQPYEITQLNGVNVCYFKAGKIKNVSKIKRAIHESLLSYYAWKACKTVFKENPQDLIVYYSPSIFWGLLVNKLKKQWNAPSYLIVRDFFPQWAIDNGLLKANSLITRYFRYFESLNYQAADTIAIQSPKNLAWFEKTSHSNKPLELLYNWASNTPILKNDHYYRKKLGLEEKVVYFYGGNMGHAQDMMNIIRLVRAMQNQKNAHFVLVGAGDEVKLINQSIKQQALKNITVLPPVSQNALKMMLSEFDIGLFTLHPDHTTHNFPGKLLGYMVQNMPILGSINAGNDLQCLMEKAEAGLITVNGDDQNLLKNALKLLQDESLRINMGNNANKLLRELFSVQTTADKIIKFFQKKIHSEQ